MAKQADVEFRIRSRDLSAKSIEKITQELQELIDTQERQRTTAAASSATVKSLEADYKRLGATLNDLATKRNAVEVLVGRKQELDAAKARLNDLRRELAELLSIRSRGTFIGDIDKAIKNVQKSVSGAERDFNKAANGVERLENSLRSLGVDASKTEQALRDIASAQDQAVVAQARTSQALQEQRQALVASSAAMAQQEEAVRQAVEAEKRYQQELADSIAFEQKRADAARRFRQAELQQTFDTAAQLEQQRAAQDALERKVAAQVRERDAALRVLEINRRADAVEARLAQQRRNLAGSTTSLATASQRAARAQADLSEQGRRALSFTQRLRGQILSLASAYFGVFEAINTIRRAVQVDIERQGALVRLQVAEGGDLRRAGEEMNFVREQADRLGQSLTPLANLYSRFKIAAEGAGQTAETTRKTFTDFAEAATVLQLSQENVDGIFRALEQSFSKGVIQAEELRGQLGDRLPGAFTKLAAAIGVSTAELNKLLEEGAVSANALPLLGEFLADEVASGLPEATQNLRADLERLKTAFDDFLESVARGGLREELQGLSQELSTFFRSEEGQQFAREVAAGFSQIIEAGRGLLQILPQIVLAFKALIAVAVARWVSQFVVGVGQGVRALNLLRTTATAASVSVRNLGRAVATSLGPISLIITLAAEAFFYFKSRADEATESIEDQEDAFDKLAEATASNRGELLGLAEAEQEALTNSRNIAAQKRDEALARLGNAKAIVAELKAQNEFSKTEVIRSRGEFFTQESVTPLGRAALETIGEAQAEVDKLDAQLQKLDVQISRGEARISGARAKKTAEDIKREQDALREFEAIRTELNDKANQERFKKDKAYYDALVNRARVANKELRGVSQDNLKASTEDAADSFNQFFSRLRADRAGVDLSALTKSTDKAASRAKKAAEKLAEDRKQIAERTADALADIESDIAQVRIEKEATTSEQIQANLQQQLLIIDKDIQKRRMDLEDLRRQAQKLKAPGSIDTANKGLGELDTLREEQRARAKANAVLDEMKLKEKQLNDLLDVRNAKLDTINTQQELNIFTQSEAQARAFEVQSAASDALLAKLTSLQAYIEANRDQLSKFINVDAELEKLGQLKVELESLPTPVDRAKTAIAEDFAGGAADAIGALAEGIAGAVQGVNSIGDAFKNAATSFQAFLSEFLIGIGKAILEAIILQAIMNAIRGTSGGYGNAALGALGGGTAHDGAVMGAPNGTGRMISPLVFANAPRYHAGGLLPGEVPVIAQTGEEILSRTDPRNALNGGTAQKAQDIKIVNAIDSASVVSEALNLRSGQEPIMNLIKARAREINNYLGKK